MEIYYSNALCPTETQGGSGCVEDSWTVANVFAPVWFGLQLASDMQGQHKMGLSWYGGKTEAVAAWLEPNRIEYFGERLIVM